MAKAPVSQKKETNIETLKNVIFLYSSVSVPREQLNTDNKPPLSDSPLEFHSFEIKVLISEARFKALKKDYRGAKNLVNAKDFDKEDLLEAYDFLDEDDLEDEMFLVKFAQTALVGKEGKRRESYPIRQIGIKGKVQDNLENAIEFETALGNGTKGHFQFRPVEGAKGLYLYPHLVCVTELVEYTGGTIEEDDEALGIEDLDEVDLDEVVLDEVEGDEPEPEPKTKPTKKAKPTKREEKNPSF